jgi:glycosyltransferase involved in cell wall biosynthesis
MGYGAEFFKKITEEETRQARLLAHWIVGRLTPESVVDFGCADGLYLRPFQDLGIKVLGIDSAPAAAEVKQIDNFMNADMTTPLDVGRFDAAICLETLEHIEPEKGDAALDNLCQAADTIVFSAAVPGQGGEEHINLRPKEYWVEKFRERGFFIDQQRTADLVAYIKKGPHLGWFVNNVMVLRKAELIPATPKKKMRFHIIALPHTQTSKTHNLCAYTMKVFNFCKMMMSLGHEVFHYGAEGSNPDCTEHIQIISNKEQEEFFGPTDLTKFYPIEWEESKPYWGLTNHRAIAEIIKRKQKGDFICVGAGGRIYAPIAEALKADCITSEFGVGYEGTFTKFRVFESYAVMHLIYGSQTGFNSNGNHYDCVIPNFFDPKDFPAGDGKKGDYFLYLGRLISRKGILTAIEVCKRLGKTLVIAGQGVKTFDKFPATGKTPAISKIVTDAGEEFEGPIEFVGIADVKKRTELYHGAIATFVPTDYIEPFGGVNVESQLCGTPVITTDFGAFPETVEHGKTGFRCRTLDHFLYAARNVSKLDPQYIRQRALENYSLDRVRLMYQEYFSMLADLWKSGWYEEHSDRMELDWLSRKERWIRPLGTLAHHDYPLGEVGPSGCGICPVGPTGCSIEDESGTLLGATGI